MSITLVVGTHASGRTSALESLVSDHTLTPEDPSTLHLVRTFIEESANRRHHPQRNIAMLPSIMHEQYTAQHQHRLVDIDSLIIALDQRHDIPIAPALIVALSDHRSNKTGAYAHLRGMLQRRRAEILSALDSINQTTFDLEKLLVHPEAQPGRVRTLVVDDLQDYLPGEVDFLLEWAHRHTVDLFGATSPTQSLYRFMGSLPEDTVSSFEQVGAQIIHLDDPVGPAVSQGTYEQAAAFLQDQLVLGRRVGVLPSVARTVKVLQAAVSAEDAGNDPLAHVLRQSDVSCTASLPLVQREINLDTSSDEYQQSLEASRQHNDLLAQATDSSDVVISIIHRARAQHFDAVVVIPAPSTTAEIIDYGISRGTHAAFVVR